MFDLCGEFHNNDSLDVVGWLLAAAALRSLQTVFTFGLKIPCGLFLPCLVTGALTGRAFATVIRLLGNDVNPGTYSMVGAVAVLGGVTRMTVSLAVIMYEITGATNFIAVFMMVVLVAKFVGDCTSHSVYNECIIVNKLPFLNADSGLNINAVASDIMKKNIVCISVERDETVRDVRSVLESCDNVRDVPVVLSESSMVLHGFIRRKDVLNHIQTMSKRSKCTWLETQRNEETKWDAEPLMQFVEQCYHQCGPETPITILFTLKRSKGMTRRSIPCCVTLFSRIFVNSDCAAFS